MQIQRSLLFVAIGVVTYLMILAWKNDFTNTEPAQQVVSTQTEASQSNTWEDDLPDVTQAPAEIYDDIALVGEKTTTDSNTSSIINVKTDVYDLDIDLVGGDITRVALLNYPRRVDTPNEPFVLMDEQRSFVAQSGLIGADGTDKNGQKARWTAEKTHYALKEGKEQLIVSLQLEQESGTVITRQYIFERNNYLIKNRYTVNNTDNSKPWRAALYGQIKRDGSDDPTKDTAGFAPMPTYMGGAYWAPDKPYNKIKLSDIRDKSLNIEHNNGWIAFIQHYFLTAWVPSEGVKYKYGTHYNSAKDEYILRFISAVQEVSPGEVGEFNADFFVGPKLQDELKAISPGLHMTVDYGWLWFISQPIFALLVFLQSGNVTIFGKELSLGFGVGNWGVAIILLTLIIKLVFFKLSATSYRSMARMRKAGPQMQRIRDEYKNDKQKQSMELMKLYKREQINPLGGCLPILVQMPVFISLYYVLLESVELRQAPFFGWIQDLSLMDPFFILPLLMGASMFIQMRLNPAPQDPTQAQIMKWMPVAFTIFFLWFPAGLVLYWLTNNLLSIAQQWIITRSIERES
ncbi:MAG TPA: membrane protein insertase YidC [Alcanivoracaceae bacterium]|nr:membrane protein insertase YidC [Alcanivoracaceae bacterium]